MRTVTVNLSDADEARILRAALQRGMTVEEYVQRQVKADSEHEATPPPPTQTVSQMLIEIANSTPADIPHPPADLASEHDHYLYGTPKPTE